MVLVRAVVGCADKLEPSTPPLHSVWYSVRSGDTLTVHCNHSSDAVYHLHCDNNQWTGDVINCTEASFNPGFNLFITASAVEVCMGMGIPIPMHVVFGLLMGMGMEMEMGIVVMGMGIAYFIGKKIKFPSLSTGSVSSLLLLHSNMQ